MLLPRPQPQPPKIIDLFAHQKFYMTRNNESDILTLSPLEKIQSDADLIVSRWLDLGLRTPRAHRANAVFNDAKLQFKQIMRDVHPHIPKLSVEQILCSMSHFKCASTDPQYRPVKKYLLKKLSITEFIWEDYNRTSQLLIHLDPPKTIIPEVDPKLTKEIYRQYSMAKWGQSDELGTMHRPTFVMIANRLIKYLKEVDNKLQPLMGLSSKTPARAAYALIQANNVTRSDFMPQWLGNDYSIGNLDRWLKDQGFFKPACRAI